jgi:hypothetical protein
MFSHGTAIQSGDALIDKTSDMQSRKKAERPSMVACKINHLSAACGRQLDRCLC